MLKLRVYRHLEHLAYRHQISYEKKNPWRGSGGLHGISDVRGASAPPSLPLDPPIAASTNGEARQRAADRVTGCSAMEDGYRWSHLGATMLWARAAP